jgi:rusticyanin
MKRTRLATVIGVAAVAAVGLGGGAAIAACGSTGQAATAAGTSSSSGYSYYRLMMGRLYSGSAGSSGMMGGSPSRSWMMGGSGYRWMMGGLDAPAWMRGHALPGFMMGTSSDPGKIMGALFAGAPGSRVSPAQATRVGSQIPAGATVSRAQHRITFSSASVRLAILASPPGGRDETFRVAGMTNPAIVVRTGTRVSFEVVNADSGAAHGLVVTVSGAASSWMPMMAARPAFAGSALWFLGSPTSAGMHTGTLSFTAAAPGTYRYLCPVPGHAQKGMTGAFIVTAAT